MYSWLGDAILNELGGDLDGTPRKTWSPVDLTKACQSFRELDRTFYEVNPKRRHIYRYDTHDGNIYCEVNMSKIYKYKYKGSSVERMIGKTPDLEKCWVLISDSSKIKV